MSKDSFEALRQEPPNRWQPPEFIKARAAQPGPVPTREVFSALAPIEPTPEQLEPAINAARETGYREGFEEGRQAGEQQASQAVLSANEAIAAQLNTLLENTARAVAELDQRLGNEISEVVAQAASEVVNGELAMQPETIRRVVTAALEAFSGERAELTLRVHPQDAAILDGLDAIATNDRSIRIVPDPALTPGGCYIDDGASELDATVERRLQAMRLVLTSN